MRTALPELVLQRRNTEEDLDRFIRNRSAMDFGYALSMLTEGRKGIGKLDVVGSPSRSAYQKRLAEALTMNRIRILAFKNKPPKSAGNGMIQREMGSLPVKKKRHISQTADRKLDAPEILDDFNLNLIGDVKMCLQLLYLWDASNGGHQRETRVDALAWNNHILTTAGMDAKIINSDVRVQEHIVERYKGHQLDVCGLKWSSSGQQLASGGNDNLLFIWDRSMASSTSRTQWLHRREDHTGVVKALAWCPFQGNLLASGDGGNDQCIKFWNLHTGACLNSVGTGSQVCTLLWNKHERELLSTHGFTDNQLILWKYPSMTKMAELYGNTSRILSTAESPNGYTVATAAGDETVQVWNVFGTPEVAKHVSKAKPEPFSGISRIR